MNKRKYILKRQDLYNSSSDDFVVEKALQPKQSNQKQKSENSRRVLKPLAKDSNQTTQRGKQNLEPVTHNDLSRNEFLKIVDEHAQHPQAIEQQTQRKDETQSRQKSTRKQTKKNVVPFKNHNTPISFSSSLNKTQPIRNQNNKTNHKKSKSKQKSVLALNPSRNVTKDKSIIKLNFSEPQNITGRCASGKKKHIKQKIQNSQNYQEQANFLQNPSSLSDQQCIPIDSIISPNLPKTQTNQKHPCQSLTIKKQKQRSPLPQPYLKQIDSQLYFLQTQLKNSQAKNKQLQEILSTRQTKLDQQHKQSIRLYKQNKDLSDMIRDLQQLMHKKSIQYEKTILQYGTQMKQKQDQCKILQAERDTLLRKKDRMKQQIDKLYDTIKMKDAQIMSQKQKETFLISENQQLIAAYERLKQQLSQALQINQTQKFFSQLVKKGQEQTARNNFALSTYKCPQCHQTTYGTQNASNELNQYHMNTKFKNHIKTYEEQVKYWKDELKFMKTQHQHEIENIRTVLQCTFQKSLMEKEGRYEREINELKKAIEIQEELITNYKNVIGRKEKITTKEQICPKTSSRSNSIESSHKVTKQDIEPKQKLLSSSRQIESKKTTKPSSIFQSIETARSRSYLSDRQVIEQVLAQQQEYRPRKNTSVIKMKQSSATLKDSVMNSSVSPDKERSILQSFKRKVQISESNFNSKEKKENKENQKQQRQPLSDLGNRQ